MPLEFLVELPVDLFPEESPDMEDPPAGLLWLRTSSFDHQDALRNYEARGFEVYTRRSPPT